MSLLLCSLCIVHANHAMSAKNVVAASPRYLMHIQCVSCIVHSHTIPSFGAFAINCMGRACT